MIKILYMSAYGKGYKLFCKYVLSTCYMPGAGLGAGDTTMENWPPKSCTDGPYILVEETDNKWNKSV